jgi:uncharacterized protein (DUF983 family)
MASFRRHLQAIWKKQCPRCFRGAIYRHGMNMHARCPECGLLLEREQGYFMGAMYISYALASVILGLGSYGVYLLLPDWDLGVIVLLVGVAFLPFVPAVTRYARIIWIHFDRWAWPDQSDPPR